MRLFAEDHEAWQESFFNAWEKMQQNGYDQWELTQASDNGHLLSQTEWYDYKGHGCGIFSPYGIIVNGGDGVAGVQAPGGHQG